MSEQLREDVKAVSEGRVERIARPGHWRVFKLPNGRIKIEIQK